MFNLRRKRAIDGSELLTSCLFDEISFYKTFIKDLKSARSLVIIESPFMTERRALQLAGIFKKLKKRGVTVRVNTRNPRHHDKPLEAQSWKALFILKKAGVKVRTYNDLRHRKLAVIDNTILWDGSLNILSQSRSKEVMRRTVSPQLCRQMLSFTHANKRYW